MVLPTASSCCIIGRFLLSSLDEAPLRVQTWRDSLNTSLMPMPFWPPIGPSEPLAVVDSLGDFSKHSKRILRTGIQAIAKIEPAHYKTLFELTLQSIAHPGYGFEIPDQALSQIGLPEDEARAAFSAAYLAIVSIVEEGDSSDRFVDALVKAGLAHADHVSGLREFTNVVESKRAELAPALSEVELVSDAMPTLDAFETAVDVRLGFEGDRLRATVPVLIAHVDTSALDQELWFQMTRAQVEHLIADLQTALRRLDHAQSLLPQRESK